LGFPGFPSPDNFWAPAWFSYQGRFRRRQHSGIQHLSPVTEHLCRNANKKLVRHRHFTDSQLRQYGIGIPAPVSVRYRWLLISPALLSYAENMDFGA
jgi:hypothetical protein